MKEMKVSKIPIYYRDLNEQLKEEYRAVWKDNKQTKLLEAALEDETDIVVGFWVQSADAMLEDYKDKTAVVE